MYLSSVEIDEKVKREFYLSVAKRLQDTDILENDLNFKDILILGTSLTSYSFLDKDGWNKLLDMLAIKAAQVETLLQSLELFAFFEIL